MFAFCEVIGQFGDLPSGMLQRIGGGVHAGLVVVCILGAGSVSGPG